ncbi:PPOX oxidase, partial [Amia calva]|nr:PPOX oxidase [Amia calva]
VLQIVLLEAGARVGGWLHSTRREDGAVFEHGPRGIRPAGAVGKATLNMVSELGLDSDVLPVPSDHVASMNRFLYVGGKLHRMPSGVVGVLRTVPPFSRPLVLSVLKELVTRRGDSEDESIHRFVERRLGKELADIAIDSLCRGVFAGDCRQLSVRSCFPPLFRAEQDHGSIVLGMLWGGEKKSGQQSALVKRSREERWTQWSLRRGMQTLPDALEERLKASGRVEIHTNAPVCSLSRTGGGNGWEIALQDGTVKADHILSAVPAQVLGSLLPPDAQPLSEELRSIPSVSVAVVNLEYEGSVLPVMGFGHLVPSCENRTVLGIVYDSVPFPQHNRRGEPTTRLTVMMGGAWFSEVFGSTEQVTDLQLRQAATQAVKTHLGVSSEPLWGYVALQKNCIPQYTLGHWKRLENIRQYINHHDLPLTLAGASYDGVSVNDVIHSGRTAVEGFLGKA